MMLEADAARALGWLLRIDALGDLGPERELRELVAALCAAAAMRGHAHEPFEQFVRAFELVKAALDAGDIAAAAKADASLAERTEALIAGGIRAPGERN